MLQNRGFFKGDKTSGCLDIREVKVSDQGVFTCRVDFRTQQRLIYKITLTVDSKLTDKKVQIPSPPFPNGSLYVS